MTGLSATDRRAMLKIQLFGASVFLILCFLLGIALGYLRWASGRLGTAMIAHAVFNMSQLTLLYLTVANSH